MSQISWIARSPSQSDCAGEVIERPASVVKEIWLENSIDASKPDVVENRRSRIEVDSTGDNGEGITHDEVVGPLRRHATSKTKVKRIFFVFERWVPVVRPCSLLVSILTLLIGARRAPMMGPNWSQKAAKLEGLSCRQVSCRDQDHSGRSLIHLLVQVFKEPAGRAIPYRDILDCLSWPILRLPTLINDGKEMTKQRTQVISGKPLRVPMALRLLRRWWPQTDLDFEVTYFFAWIDLCQSQLHQSLYQRRYIKNFCSIEHDGYGSKLMVGRFPLAIVNIQIDPS